MERGDRVLAKLANGGEKEVIVWEVKPGTVEVCTPEAYRLWETARKAPNTLGFHPEFIRAA
jgi:hypothetical protein